MVAMQKTTTLALSLVILLCGFTTHARSSDLLAPVEVDETLLNVKDTATEQVKDELSGNESVVLDWNLVCEELCRASLGGPPCAPQCSALPETFTDTRTAAADLLLGDAKYDICTILCVFDLGETSCGCNERTQVLKDQLNRNTICKAFCMLGNITIKGCSTCSSHTFHPAEAKTTTTASIKIKDQDTVAKISGASDTIQQTTSSTTPDWNVVCLSLCKIGEGGSLCNCDLPPFF